MHLDTNKAEQAYPAFLTFQYNVSVTYKVPAENITIQLQNILQKALIRVFKQVYNKHSWLSLTT